jgi:hypothetical protein
LRNFSNRARLSRNSATCTAGDADGDGPARETPARESDAPSAGSLPVVSPAESARLASLAGVTAAKERRIKICRFVAFRSAIAAPFRGAKSDTSFCLGPNAFSDDSPDGHAAQSMAPSNRAIHVPRSRRMSWLMRIELDFLEKLFSNPATRRQAAMPDLMGFGNQTR